MSLFTQIIVPTHCQKPCVHTATGQWQCWECGHYIEDARKPYYEKQEIDESWPKPEEVYPPESIYRYDTF